MEVLGRPHHPTPLPKRGSPSHAWEFCGGVERFFSHFPHMGAHTEKVSSSDVGSLLCSSKCSCQWYGAEESGNEMIRTFGGLHAEVDVGNVYRMDLDVLRHGLDVMMMTRDPPPKILCLG